MDQASWRLSGEVAVQDGGLLFEDGEMMYVSLENLRIQEVKCEGVREIIGVRCFLLNEGFAGGNRD